MPTNLPNNLPKFKKKYIGPALKPASIVKSVFIVQIMLKLPSCIKTDNGVSKTLEATSIPLPTLVFDQQPIVADVIRALENDFTIATEMRPRDLILALVRQQLECFGVPNLSRSSNVDDIELTGVQCQWFLNYSANDSVSNEKFARINASAGWIFVSKKPFRMVEE